MRPSSRPDSFADGTGTNGQVFDCGSQMTTLINSVATTDIARSFFKRPPLGLLSAGGRDLLPVAGPQSEKGPNTVQKRVNGN